jgi:hypothetical protein
MTHEHVSENDTRTGRSRRRGSRWLTLPLLAAFGFIAFKKYRARAATGAQAPAGGE